MNKNIAQLITTSENYVVELPNLLNEETLIEQDLVCCEQLHESPQKYNGNQYSFLHTLFLKAQAPQLKKLLKDIEQIDFSLQSKIYLPSVYEEKVYEITEDIFERYAFTFRTEFEVNAYKETLLEFVLNVQKYEELYEKIISYIKSDKNKKFVADLEVAPHLLIEKLKYKYSYHKELDYWVDEIKNNPQILNQFKNFYYHQGIEISLKSLLSFQELSMYDNSYLLLSLDEKKNAIFILGSADNSIFVKNIADSKGLFFSEKDAQAVAKDIKNEANINILAYYKKGNLLKLSAANVELLEQAEEIKKKEKHLNMVLEKVKLTGLIKTSTSSIKNKQIIKI